MPGIKSTLQALKARADLEPRLLSEDEKGEVLLSAQRLYLSRQRKNQPLWSFVSSPEKAAFCAAVVVGLPALWIAQDLRADFPERLFGKTAVTFPVMAAITALAAGLAFSRRKKRNQKVVETMKLLPEGATRDDALKTAAGGDPPQPRQWNLPDVMPEESSG